MRYMLVNVGPGGLQIDLHSPNASYNKKNLHRPGPVVALSIGRGQSIDILPYFDGSVYEAHMSIKYSRDVLRLLKPHLLNTYVCNDEGKQVDVEALLSGKIVESTLKSIEDNFSEETEDNSSEETGSQIEDTTKPDMGQGEVLAKVDQHEAEMTGEANPLLASDDLTQIKGVGEAMANKLHEAGYTSLEFIAKADVKELSKISGPRAKDIKKQAELILKK